MYQHIMVPSDSSELAKYVILHVEAIAIGCTISKVTLVRMVEFLHLYGGLESRFSHEKL